MTNPIPKLDVQQCLQATVLGSLGDEALGRMGQIARIEYFDIPTLLSSAGEHPKYLRLVIQGHIETIARSASGEEFVFSYITPGGWATWLSCFLEKAPDHDFYSSDSACFIALPISGIKKLCERYPQIYPLLIQEIGRRMRLLMEWTGQSVLVGPVPRMAKLLHLLSREQKPNSNSITLHITQARLASLARCSRQTANKLLHALEQEQLIIAGYGQFEIPDLSRLAAFAEDSEPIQNDMD
jgi:CRP/FNR family cyclic AMP-dependent transcriptional regulator